MKQKLLSLLLLLCALITGSGSAWADETIEITYSNFSNTSYNTSESTFSQSGFTFGYVNAMKNGANGTPSGWAKEQVIQTKSGGSIYNKTAIPGLKSIRVYIVTNTNSFTVTSGTSAQPTTNSVTRPSTATGTESITYSSYVNKTVTSGQTTTASYYDFTVNNEYFKIAPGGSLYIWKIVLTYTPTHTLTYSATNGSIGGVVYNTSTAVASGASVAEGGKVTLTAEPADGYVFSTWEVSGTGSTLSSTTTNPTTFTMGTANATVTANFVVAATPTALAVKTAPTKLNYKVGETLDLTGLVLEATIGGNQVDVTTGYTAKIGETAVTSGTTTLNSVGAKTVTFTYGGQTATQTIHVGELKSIAITTAPTKTTYYEDQTFDPTGMLVTATFSDLEESPTVWTENVTAACTFEPDGALETSDTEVTVSYVWDGVNKTADQTITVTTIPTYTAHFSVNGIIDNNNDCTDVEGASITFPSDPADISGKKFMGWYTEEYTNATTAPSSYVNTATATMGNSNVTYYAVFATVSASTTPANMVINTSTSNFPTAYGTANAFDECTLNGKKFQIQQGYVNGTKLQWRASGNASGTGTMYNSDAINKIQSIVLLYASDDGNKNFTVQVGTSANPTSSSAITPSVSQQNTSEYTFTSPSGNYDYFVMTNGSGAGYLTSITINYLNETQTVSNYCTTVASYTLTYTTANGSVSGKIYNTETAVASGSSVASGTQVTLTAVPNDGYRVVSGDGGYTVTNGTATVLNNGDNTFTVTPTSNCAITINLEAIPTRTITVGSHDGGSVTIENAGTPVASGSSVREGTILTITAAANDGKRFSSWSLTGATPESSTTSPTTFTVGDNNVTIGATFSVIYGVTVNSASNGSMVAEPTSAIEGETVTLTATPASGYELSALTVTNNSTSATIATSGTGNSRTFTMPAAAVTVAPTFGPQKGSVDNPYTVAEVTSYITGGGTGNKYTRGIVSTAGTSVSSGKMTYYISDDGTTTNQLMIYSGKNLENANFTATTDLKVGDRVIIYGPVTYYQSTTPEYTTGNYVYTLSRDFTLTLDDMTNGSATIEVNGVEQTPNGDGEVTVASGATVTLTATPADGYAFGKWTSTDDTWNNNTENPLEFTMPFDDVMFGATFADASVKYDIVVDDAVVGGSIEADVAEAKAGATVTLTATPDDGYVFDSWDVQDESSNVVTVTSNQFTMPASDVTVTATFLPIYTVNYYIGGVKNSTTRVSGEELNLDAPSTGFAGWSTANSAASPVFMANDAAVTSDLDVYAVFYESYTADYRLVEANQADWRGDYLIAYDDDTFADGRKGGTDTDCIGKQNVSVNPGDNLSGKVVDLEWGDTYNVTLEAIDASDLSKGYVLKTKDGKYNYQTSNTNGLTSTENKATAANYPITVTFTSSSDVKLCLGGNADGAVFRYNTGGYFRYYKDGGQSAVYLYKRTQTATYSLDVHESVTIGESGYASYCSLSKLDFTDSDVKAYKASVNNTTGKVTLTKVNVVPAEEGVILHCATPGNYYIPVTAEEASDVTGNQMVGVLTRTQVLWNPDTDVYNYILQQGQFNKANGGYLKANRAYLTTPYDVTAQDARALTIVFEESETTGINSIENGKLTMENGAWYTLGGQKLNGKPATKGIYIINGKKVVVK